jgi:hypothetical protein
VNPNITPANIHATICNSQWSTKSIRPPVSYTNDLKKKQLADPRYQDKTPGHYEEDHRISLELGGPLQHVPSDQAPSVLLVDGFGLTDAPSVPASGCWSVAAVISRSFRHREHV